MKPVGDYLRDNLQAVVDAAIERREGGPHSQPAQQAVKVIKQELTNFPLEDAKQFGQKLDTYVTSADFAQVVNQAVPPPQPGETEEVFVVRAKQAIRDALLKKFGL